ncbi:MAG: DUF1304 domain-containing protein [Myxococcota bacterium]
MGVEMLGAIAVVLVAVAHVGFLVLESVLWTRPFGRKTFRLSVEDAERTKLLASNQGVYNGMLAVGLLWALATGETAALSFLLVFVVVVGLFGGFTVKPTIFALQAAPAAVALALVRLGL